MPPPNRLAPDPYNSLYYSVPDPAALGPQYAPPLPLRQRLENVSAGLGRGVTTQLQDVQALLSDPRAYATNTLRGLRELVRNPALVGNVLRDTARRATSGPLGLGEVAGEMLPLSVRSKVPNVTRMTEPTDFIRRRERQIVNQETAEDTATISHLNMTQHRQNVEALMQNQSWLMQTAKQADVIAKLNDLGLPVDRPTELRDWRNINESLARINDPYAAFTAKTLVERNRSYIDEGFNEYLAAVRKYRSSLNPRSKYDRQRMQEIDTILGDARITQLKR